MICKLLVLSWLSKVLQDNICQNKIKLNNLKLSYVYKSEISSWYYRFRCLNLREFFEYQDLDKPGSSAHCKSQNIP